MPIISYEDRVAKMKKPGDEDCQLRRAIAYAKEKRAQLRQPLSADEQKALAEEEALARQVVRKLRSNIFDLGEMLVQREAEASKRIWVRADRSSSLDYRQ